MDIALSLSEPSSCHLRKASVTTLDYNVLIDGTEQYIIRSDVYVCNPNDEFRYEQLWLKHAPPGINKLPDSSCHTQKDVIWLLLQSDLKKNHVSVSDLSIITDKTTLYGLVKFHEQQSNLPSFQRIEQGDSVVFTGQQWRKYLGELNAGAESPRYDDFDAAGCICRLHYFTACVLHLNDINWCGELSW
jgi:hypothetical protein